ncbi:hypothetical protein PCH_Pc22g27060 [Penicillium rubens Wisconsin 54-1255]|uniref:Uncharacterized protein n=1 Tax=Penicillium rubens (strain ATCC 28089 / DSM 1075 / NRRL 1951 / Wisconsin 54-1255) TaxID=500485 RepID=B6HUR3_PENRW|nr:hypothetical protein PCH_Pc22g27060 [Penicillium rubens Wisconsin 54-1255]
MYIRQQLQYLPRNSSALWLLGRVLRKIPGSVFTKNAGGGLIRTLAIKARANLQKMVESQGEFRQKGFARCRNDSLADRKYDCATLSPHGPGAIVGDTLGHGEGAILK